MFQHAALPGRQGAGVHSSRGACVLPHVCPDSMLSWGLSPGRTETFIAKRAHVISPSRAFFFRQCARLTCAVRSRRRHSPTLSFTHTVLYFHPPPTALLSPYRAAEQLRSVRSTLAREGRVSLRTASCHVGFSFDLNSGRPSLGSWSR